MLKIKILGSGCPNCKKLEALTRQAVELQSVTSPELAPSPDCSCPNCSKEKE